MRLWKSVNSGRGRGRHPDIGRRLSATGQLAALAVLATMAVSPSQALASSPAIHIPAAPKVPSATVHRVAGKPVKLKDQTTGNHWKGKAPSWPKAGSATAVVAGGTTSAPAGAARRAGNTPLWISGLVKPGAHATTKTSALSASTSVSVTMKDHSAALKAGVNGVIFTAAAAPSNGDGATRLSVSLDYSGFKDAVGGDWSSRLHLVELPACALTTPAKPACRVQTPIRGSKNYPAKSQVSAPVDLAQAPTTSTSVKPLSTDAVAPQMMVLAATAGVSGGAGDYSATPLSPSGSWSAGGSSGDYTYTYPIALPPSAGGLAPSLALSYDSQSIDGRLASTNSQASWIGDGWSLEPGSISRSYMACSDDPAGTAPKTSDECWAGQILHVSFAGHSDDIIQDASAPTGWKLSGDDGSKVELLTTAGQNDTYDGDYWKITTTDGTQYFFGRNKLPGYTGTTNSAWTVPVYGAHTGDPCYNATFAQASCAQAWQWNMDEVVDAHGNAITYYYNKETNYYGADNGTTGVSYTRGGYLDHIDYGLGNGITTAPQRVTFTTADRCTATTCDPIASNSANWPDVPYDLNCNSGATCGNHSPSFWNTRRLTTITTGTYDSGTKTYPAVDTYSLVQSFPDPGDNTKPALWLNSITHTGNTGTAISLPAVKFTGIKLANRYNTSNGYPDLVRYRLAGIATETGDAISISYSSASCSTPSDPSTNTGRCFPVYWTPVGQPSPLLDWFNKYVVNSVTDNDTTGGSPGTITSYTYLGNPAWHYDDNEIVKSKFRTYGQWRGYPEVQVRSGTTADGQTLSDTLYYQGMDGDTLPGGKTRSANVTLSSAVTVPGAQTTVPDSALLAGKVRESIAYKGSGGAVATANVNNYWISAPSATRSRSGLPDLTANYVEPSANYTTQAITSGATTTWRSTQSFSSYDKSTGLMAYTDDRGDISVPTQETCTSTTYAPANTSANIIGLAAEVETDQGACGIGSSSTSDGRTAPTGVSRPADVLSDTRTFYDTNPTAWPVAVPSWPQSAPTTGDVTVIQQATDYSGGAFTYQTKAATSFDTYGRPAADWDALGDKTSTSYTTSGGLTTSKAVTNAKGQTSTTTVDPTRGLPTSVVDSNGARTDTTYDALGRGTATWLPGRDKATQTASVTYDYLISATAPSAVTTKKLNQDGSYATSVAIFDALLRSRQTQTQSPAGGRLLTDTYYDTHGWAVRKNNAYWDASTNPGTTLVSTTDPQVTNQDLITYDGLGRPVLDVSQDKASVVSQTRTIYGGDRTTVIPATGGTPTTTFTDARGRTVETDNYTAMPTVTGDQVTGGSPSKTTFAYDTSGSHGQMASITDPGGNKRTYTYNLLGQKTAQSDPDTGSSHFTYDADGQVTSTTDANGNTVTVDYDDLGRKTGAYNGADDKGTQLASWTYDDPAVPNSAGRLTQSTRYVGGGAYTEATTGYTINGQVTGSSVTIPSSETGLAGTYTYANTYTTVTELPLTTSFPAAGSLPTEKVSYGYNSLDEETSVGGLVAYTTGTTYDAFARVSQMTVGKLGNRNVVTTAYNEHTGAIDEVTSTRVTTPQAVDDTKYTRDLAGNITRIADVQGASTSTDTQCYTYDLLGRMTQAWTATDSCSGAPTTSGTPTVGGPNAYWTSWGFDADGNRKTQTQHGLTSSVGDTVTQYTFGQPTDATKQPDTLTSVKTTKPDNSTTTGTYTYDAAGNTTSTPTSSSLTWNSEGSLATLTGNGTSASTGYLYDADGSQLIRTDANGDKTLFLPGQEVIYHEATGTTTGTRSIPLPGGVSVERSGSANSYSYVLDNDQGTGAISLDYTGQNATYRPMTPYGAPRGTQPTNWPTDQGLVGGTTDAATGLTNLGAREYDPTTGRFLSADPILEATDPNQIGGYTYAGDNPVTLSDPSGLRPLGPTDSEQGDEDYYQQHNMQGSGWTNNGHGWDYVEVHHYGGMIGEGATVTTVRTIYSQYEVKHYHAPTDERRQIHIITKKDTPGTFGRIVGALLGADDLNSCSNGSIMGCAMFGMVFVPGVGELKAGEDAVKGVRAAEDAAKAANAADAPRLQAKLAAEELAGADGHAFDKHVLQQGEFPGIRTRQQFANMIEDVILNGERRVGGGGRSAYWRNGVIVIRNPRARDGGTVFAPKEGYEYFTRNFRSE